MFSAPTKIQPPFWIFTLVNILKKKFNSKSLRKCVYYFTKESDDWDQSSNDYFKKLFEFKKIFEYVFVQSVI
jgi:hypothetical protein